MYLHPNVQVQEQFFSLLLDVMENHSEKSQKSLLLKLKQLHQREGDIIQIYGVYRDYEFQLCWRRVDEYREPIEGQPFMVGGLVYHPHSDEWGIHT